MKAFLPNFEVSWPMWSEAEQSGYSGIMEAPGELVHGALYEMTEQELIAMDNLEDCYKGTYKRETFLVLGEDGNQSIQIGSDTCNKSMICPLIKKCFGHLQDTSGQSTLRMRYRYTGQDTATIASA